MIRYSSQVTIARPAHEVFEALLDAPTYERWTDMTETRFNGTGRPAVGTTGFFRMPSGPMAGPYDMEILELDPDRRLLIKVSSSKVDWRAETTLEPDGDGTRMTYAGEISLKGLLRAMEPMAAGEVRRGEAQEAEKFKALLESDPTVGRPREAGAPAVAG